MDELMNKLIRKAIRGDESAYTEVISYIQSDLYRVAKAKLNSLDDINDAIQETIYKSYKKLKSLKYPDYFKTWIIKILINECNMTYRKRKKQLGIFNKLANKTTLVHNTEKDIQDAENKIDFEILIEKLNYDERLIITLYYNNKYSISEISDIIHMNINTTKSKFKRARDKLENLYKDTYKEGGIKNEARK